MNAIDTTALPAIEAIAKIDFDLTMIRYKLANPEDGEPWTLEQLDLVEQEYRRYMALCLTYPEEAIVPSRTVDQMWHAHILDTRAYREDCDRVFGFFYDHYPYFGLNGPADAANLATAYDTTLDLYEVNFGIPPEGVWGPVSAAKCRARCRTGCKPMKCK